MVNLTDNRCLFRAWCTISELIPKTLVSRETGHYLGVSAVPFTDIIKPHSAQFNNRFHPEIGFFAGMLMPLWRYFYTDKELRE